MNIKFRTPLEVRLGDAAVALACALAVLFVKWMTS